MTTPDDGHKWEITVTGTMSSSVVGEEHHRDANWSHEHSTTVRAWSLPEAMQKASMLPLQAWSGFSE